MVTDGIVSLFIKERFVLDNNKRNVFLLIMFSVVAMLVFTAYSAAPPKVESPACDDPNCENHGGEGSIMEGMIKEIDQTTAKTVVLQLDELSNEDCANQIADSLAKLVDIGKIKCDLGSGKFEVQYDPGKLTEEQVVKAFTDADHPGRIIDRL